MGMIQIDMKMPKCCDECFALDDHGDYPFCLISQDQRGYTFNTKEKRMPTCPLKAREPRVMTLEEVLALPYDTPIYIENCDGLHGWDIFSGTTKDDDNEVVTGASWATAEYWSQDEYGDTWRCWTTQPTKKQMDAEEWE